MAKKKRNRKSIKNNGYKLEELGITLPDDLREGKEDESRIFGKNYYELEDIKLLERNKKK